MPAVLPVELLRQHFGDEALATDGERWLMVNGDAMAVLALLGKASVDVVLTDPPYNLGAYSTGNIKMSWRKDFNNDIAAWDTGFAPEKILEHVKHVLAPTGNLFGFTTYNLLGAWHAAFDPAFDTFQFFVWHKTNPPPKLRRAGFLNACELVVCAWDRGHTWHFTKQNEMHNFLSSPICMGNERTKDPAHPTQKPVRVLQHLLRLGSNADDIVLDPYAGVGSTGVAALGLGRRFVGVELEPRYFQAAVKRLTTA